MSAESEDIRRHLYQSIKKIEDEIDQKFLELGLAGADSLPETVGFSPSHAARSLPTVGSGQTQSHVHKSVKVEPNMSPRTSKIDLPSLTRTSNLGQIERVTNCGKLEHVKETGEASDLNSQADLCSTMSKKPGVQPDVYEGKTPLEDWLTHFNLCSDINGWTEDQKTRFLAVKLRGPALQVYTDLPDPSKHSYSRLVEALRERFCPQGQTELFRAQLRARTRRKGESLQQLASDIRRLVLRAYPNVSAKFREEVGRDQFVEAIDLPDVRVQVRRAKPTTLGKALTLALEEEAFIQLECNRGPLPQKVVASTNKATSITQQGAQVSVEMETKLKQIEQTLSELKSVLESRRKKKSDSDAFPFACWECKQKGHRRAECPTLVHSVANNTQPALSQGNDNGLGKGPLPSPQ